MTRLSPQRLPVPRLWLFTDERVSDDRLMAALRRLPRGSGVVFRHYGLSQALRLILLRRVSALTRRRGLVLLTGGEPAPYGTDGIHRPGWRTRQAAFRRRKGQLLSYPAHDARDLVAARKAGADIVFLSPVFPTRSHPGGRALGPRRFGLIASRYAGPALIALGGMTLERFRQVQPLGAYGWAAIDALTQQSL